MRPAPRQTAGFTSAYSVGTKSAPRRYRLFSTKYGLHSPFSIEYTMESAIRSPQPNRRRRLSHASDETASASESTEQAPRYSISSEHLSSKKKRSSALWKEAGGMQRYLPSAS